jgi:hypothetical protein
MNWEAVSIVGLAALVVGVALYVPAWLWTRQRVQPERGRNQKLMLTKAGWVLLSLAILAIIGGFSLQYTFPESAVGGLAKTSSGRLVYLVAVVVVFWLLEAILSRLGIRLTKSDSNADEH